MNALELHYKVVALAEILTELEQEIPTLEPQLPGMELPDLLRTWRLLDWLKKSCESMQELAGSHKQPIGKLAFQRMSADATEGIDFDGCRWKPVTKNSITCPEAKQAELLVYAKTEDLKLGELIKETIHQRTLESYFNTEIQEGRAVPEMVRVFPMETVSCLALPKKKVKE